MRIPSRTGFSAFVLIAFSLTKSAIAALPLSADAITRFMSRLSIPQEWHGSSSSITLNGTKLVTHNMSGGYAFSKGDALQGWHLGIGLCGDGMCGDGVSEFRISNGKLIVNNVEAIVFEATPTSLAFTVSPNTPGPASLTRTTCMQVTPDGRFVEQDTIANGGVISSTSIFVGTPLQSQSTRL